MSLRSLPSELKTQISTYLGQPGSSEAILRTSPEYLLEEIRLYQPSFTLEGLLDYLIAREQLKQKNSITPGGKLYPLTLLHFLDSFLIERQDFGYYFAISSKRQLHIPEFLSPLNPPTINYSSHHDPGDIYEYEGYFRHSDPNIVQQLNYQAQLSYPPLPPLLKIRDFYEVNKGRVGLLARSL